MTHPGYNGVTPFIEDDKQHRREIADTVNNMLQGRLNVVTEITLTDSATTTTLLDARISFSSFIWLMPKTAAAATALPSVYITDRNSGEAKLNHASDAATDQEFDILIIG